MRGSFARSIAVLWSFGVAGSLAAGKLEKAFEALAVHNYFLAQELFRSQVKRHPAAAWYGLSVIHGRDDNPFYHLDSAYACILRADASFTHSDEKERAAINALGVDDAAIRAQITHLNQLAWEEASALNSIAAYDRYVNTYLQSERAADARRARDHLAFEAAMDVNTAAAYQDFIDRYPGAEQVYRARSRLQEAIYREGTEAGTIEAYEKFIADHPESPYAKNAEDEVYRLATAPRTAQAYHAFIKGQPMNHRVPDAWRALYELYTRELSADVITSFLKEYPDYPFTTDLLADYSTATLTLHPFRRDSLWGFIDEQGIEQIKAEYDWVEDFLSGQALVSRGGRVGSINKSGRVVIAVDHDDVQEYSEGLATVERAGRVGAVDRTGELVVPMEFDEIGEFADGLAYARKGDRYGYIDVHGAERIPFGFDMAATFHDGLAVVGLDGLSGVIDAGGNMVVPCQYDWIEGFERGVSRVRRSGRSGVISPFGDVLLAVEHDHVGVIGDSLMLVVDGAKCGYIDAGGRWVIPQEYEAAEGVATWGDFQNGVAEVQKGGKRGLIDASGKTRVDLAYQDVGRMQGRLIPVKKKDKWGYVDRALVQVVPFKYDLAWEPRNGYARVNVKGLFALVDSTGKEVIAPLYSMMSDADATGLLVVAMGGRAGVINAAGGVVVPLEYDEAQIVEPQGPASVKLIKLTRAGRFAWYRPDIARFIWKEAGFGE